MRLTPIEIQQKPFASRLRGFDPHEVRHFLELCASEVEELVRESIALKDEVRTRDALIAEHRAQERALQDTLVSARQLADELKEQARKEADIVLAEAEMQGERIVQDAHQRRGELLQEISELRRQRVRLETELRAALQSHLRVLDAFSPLEDERIALLQPPAKESRSK